MYGLARRLVALLRGDYADWTTIAQELVTLPGAHSGERLVDHAAPPKARRSIGEYVTLQLNDNKRLKLVMYRIERRPHVLLTANAAWVPDLAALTGISMSAM